MQRCSPRKAGEGKLDWKEPEDSENDGTENKRPKSNEQPSSKLVSKEEAVVWTVLKLKDKFTDI